MQIKVEGDSLNLRIRLSEMSDDLRANLRTAIGKSVADLQGQIHDKLSGPVLKVDTDRLRASISYRLDEDETSITGTVGTVVKYARIHEYGFQGTVSVREHMRTITQAFGRPLKDGPRQVAVKAHSLRMNMLQRSFLRSTLVENAPAIANRISDAIKAAVEQ